MSYLNLEKRVSAQDSATRHPNGLHPGSENLPESDLTKDSPLVSIVTPSLNQSAFIERAILSVQNQTYKNIEHIIVDGGSTDSTLDLLRQYDANLKWVCEPDDGMYDAINKGFRRSRGEILAYLNTDDEYFPWIVEAVVETFCRCPEVGLIFGDAVYIDEESGRGLPRFSPKFDLGMIRRTSLICQPTVFWKKEVFESMQGFDDSLRFAGDCDFWIRAGERFPVAKLDEILAIDAIRSDGLRYRQAIERGFYVPSHPDKVIAVQDRMHVVGRTGETLAQPVGPIEQQVFDRFRAGEAFVFNFIAQERKPQIERLSDEADEAVTGILQGLRIALMKVDALNLEMPAEDRSRLHLLQRQGPASISL